MTRNTWNIHWNKVARDQHAETQEYLGSEWDDLFKRTQENA